MKCDYLLVHSLCVCVCYIPYNCTLTYIKLHKLYMEKAYFIAIKKFKLLITNELLVFRNDVCVCTHTCFSEIIDSITTKNIMTYLMSVLMLLPTNF